MCSGISVRRIASESSGQASVEAAFLIPLLFVCLLLVIQPGIVLYDRMVMQAAATEGCRFLATKTASMSQERCESLVLRHLGSIPPQSLFHEHENGCSWEIEMAGDESSSETKVTIRNRIKLLPLFDAGGTLLGIADNGYLPIEVSATAPTQNAWVLENEQGMNPSAWVESRKEP